MIEEPNMSLIKRLLLCISVGTVSLVLAGCYGVAAMVREPALGPEAGPATSDPVGGLETAEPCAVADGR